MDFGVPQGSEQAGRRPALVVSDDTHNARARTVIVCPLTTNPMRARFPQNVAVEAGELAKDSVVLGEQLRTVSKSRLDPHAYARLDALTMERVDRALLAALSLCQPPRKETKP